MPFLCIVIDSYFHKFNLIESSEHKASFVRYKYLIICKW